MNNEKYNFDNSQFIDNVWNKPSQDSFSQSVLKQNQKIATLVMDGGDDLLDSNIFDDYFCVGGLEYE